MMAQFHIPKETIEEDEADKKEVQCPNCGEVFKVSGILVLQPINVGDIPLLKDGDVNKLKE